MNWKLAYGRYIRDPRLGHRFGINYLNKKKIKVIKIIVLN